MRQNWQPGDRCIAGGYYASIVRKHGQRFIIRFEAACRRPHIADPNLYIAKPSSLRPLTKKEVAA